MLPWSRLDCNWFPWSLTLGRATTCYQMPMATVIVPAPSQMSILLNQSLDVNHLDLTLWSLQFLNVICINHWGRKKKSYWQPFLKCQQQANAICWYFPTFCPFHMSKVHIKAHTGIHTHSYSKYLFPILPWFQPSCLIMSAGKDGAQIREVLP